MKCCFNCCTPPFAHPPDKMPRTGASSPFATARSCGSCTTGRRFPGSTTRRAAEDPAHIDKLPRSQRLSLRSVEHLAQNFAKVPLAILVMGMKGRHSTPGSRTFPAVQNLLLTARALGLSGSVFNFALSREDELRALLRIPEDNQIYCVLPIGYPTDEFGAVKRKPIKSVAYVETYGNRWEFAERQPDTGCQEKWQKQ